MRLSDLLVPSTKFSKFRCDTYKKFSANPGILYPVWYNVLNPGESAFLDLRSVIRTWPVESPLMGSIKVRFVTAAFNLKNYAIALEGYKRSFDWRSQLLPSLRFDFMNGTIDDYIKVDSNNRLMNFFYLHGVADTSLADYLGYESGWLPTSAQYYKDGVSSEYLYKSFIPFLCYYDFYRNYLINPQESKFPIFHTRLSVEPIDESLRPAITPTATHYFKNNSAVSWMNVSLLDNLIDDCHKMCDVGKTSSYPTSGNYPNSISFFDVFKWHSLPSSFVYNNINTYGCIMSSTHGGLVSTMFDSDINTQWMSVDNYQKLNEVKINTNTESGATFTSFADIVKASSLWDFVVKSVNSDGTYGDFIGNQFGVSVKGDLNIPQIVHVYDTLLSFDDITSQADTVVDPESSIGSYVGQQAGVGRSYGQSNQFKVINKDGNYVVLMTFMWATPQVCYRSGIYWPNNLTSFSDLYQPSFDNYAMQPRLQEQVKASLQAVDNSSVVYDCADTYWKYPNTLNNGPSAFAELGYQPAFSEYKSDVDVVHGLFRHSLDYYTIIRDIEPIDGSNSIISSYVYAPTTSAVWAPPHLAQRYQLPFAVDSEDCMQVQLRVGCTITRAMSKNVKPNIK